MIINLGGLVFATDLKESCKHIEYLYSEYDTQVFKLKIDRTLKPPFYELFIQYEELCGDKWRTLNSKIAGSSKLSKIGKFIEENIYQSGN
jgi:hypothetical protein